MIRTFNYTGRKRIPRTRVVVRLQDGPGGPPRFDASIDLTGLGLPAEARVFVEAYRRYLFQRFDFGSVGRLVPPEDRNLIDMPPRSLVMFRAKVVSLDEAGRILAAADRIIPRRSENEPTDKLSLLPVDFMDLGDLVWRLDLEGDWPSLQLNNRLEGIRETARSDDYFLSLIYPEVVRQILNRILIVDDYTDPEGDPDDWQSQWLRFARGLMQDKRLPPSGFSEPDLQEKLGWIERAVEAFGHYQRVLERYDRARTSGKPS
ncbi:MAG: hypothetical protein KKB20_21015 [Proteobacteria bacterium]|nr:hypothetical protein [Pseudomonadota bacterium]